MKKTLFTLILAALSLTLSAQREVNVLDLGLQGKLVETDNPFDRFNPDEYPEVYDDSKTLVNQIRSSSGYFVAFRTDSKTVQVKVEYVNSSHNEGCDIYIKKDGRWLYAGSKPKVKHGEVANLVRSMDGSMHECIVYFPRQVPIRSMHLIIDKKASIEGMECPFRHRIAALGSSFTQGAGVTRPGVTWSAQLSRMTGLMFINMGFSGNCKLQPFFAQVLGRSDAEAYVIDGFSNPSAQQIRDRLFVFIDTLRAAEKEVGKDPKPIIFLKTIWREGNNFNVSKYEREMAKMEAADQMMALACAQYDDVHWVTTTDATDYNYHETCTDGTHPNDYGYTLWAESIRKPVTKILAKYGIK